LVTVALVAALVVESAVLAVLLWLPPVRALHARAAAGERRLDFLRAGVPAVCVFA
jgi:hypothetical protein